MSSVKHAVKHEIRHPTASVKKFKIPKENYVIS
jgi:hypothetical protein